MKQQQQQQQQQQSINQSLKIEAMKSINQ